MECFNGLAQKQNVATPQLTDYQLICFDTTRSDVTYETLNYSASQKLLGKFAPITDLDQLWLLVSAGLIFFMQLGFALLEAGAVKKNSVQNILFKNLMDVCLGSIMFFLFGYGIAYGNPMSSIANGFMGTEHIVLESKTWNAFFHQWVFAGTAATIVSGSVAERCRTEAYFMYTIAITSWIYPVVAHWAWDVTGWISAGNSNPNVFGGVIDFAGSGVVHMVGGFSGLIGAIALGPRYRRFKPNTESKYAKELESQHKFGNNVAYQAIGTLILWFGWYGFNCSSTLAAQNSMTLASKVAVTTTLAAASGGITASCGSRIATYFEDKKRGGYWSIPRACNGILAGLVSITASCATVHTGSSILIGIIGAILYYFASIGLEKAKIDDPLDAFSVHGVAGAWGVLSVGIFSTHETIEFAGFDEVVNYSIGQLFLTQLTFVVVIIGWTLVNAGLVFFILKFLNILRIPKQAEKRGIDIAEFGGTAENKGATYKRTKSMIETMDHKNIDFTPEDHQDNNDDINK